MASGMCTCIKVCTCTGMLRRCRQAGEYIDVCIDSMVFMQVFQSAETSQTMSLKPANTQTENDRTLAGSKSTEAVILCSTAAHLRSDTPPVWKKSTPCHRNNTKQLYNRSISFLQNHAWPLDVFRRYGFISTNFIHGSNSHASFCGCKVTCDSLRLQEQNRLKAY